MLHYSAIDPSTLELLKKLISVKEFSNLRLVGGTSLALQIGHRISTDLDLFGSIDADKITISQILSSIGKSQLISETENINIFSVDGIKVDIVNYPYPWIDKVNLIDEIPLAGQKDIGAMKLAAITGRGSKKDFIDLYFLLQKFSLKELSGFYNEKYSDGSLFLVLKSLAYFDDAEKDISPKMLINTPWSQVKSHISNILTDYFKI
jgi:hypothetical protein